MATIQKLILPPDQDGYSFTDIDEVRSVKLDGGASRYRKDILNSNINVNVKWTLDPEQYNYIKVFYKVVLENGSMPFLIDLYIDDPFELSEHESHFVPGTFRLSSHAGLSFVVAATLEVKPIPISQANIDLGVFFGLFGAATLLYGDLFDKIMNVDLPGMFL